MGHGVLKNLGQKYPGSFIRKPHSRLLITSMSSSERWNWSTEIFSRILCLFSDLGTTAQPRCMPHRRTTSSQINRIMK